jgi:hypothetical protein
MEGTLRGRRPAHHARPPRRRPGAPMSCPGAPRLRLITRNTR